MQSTFGCGLLLCLLAVAFAAVATEARHPLVPTPLAFQRVAITNQGLTHRILSTRGGDDATLAESDDEEEEEEDKPVSKLASSAVKSTEKTRSKQTAKVKAAVSEGLSQKKQTAVQKKKKRKGLRLPYIIGACMNPFTLIAMTKAYWASLFNLDYIRKDGSQDLRSALEEKAKKGPGGGSRGKRKMRPGQAKTLSDLPQLNT